MFAYEPLADIADDGKILTECLPPQLLLSVRGEGGIVVLAG